MKKTIMAVASLFAVFPAHAGWQGTDWGQTPAQAIAASSVVLHKPTADDMTSGENGQVGAAGKISVGGEQGSVSVFFKNNRLIRVQIVFMGGKPAVILDAMSGKYGAPFGNESSFSNGCLTNAYRWQNGNDSIRMSVICGGSITAILYSPLKANAEGL